MKQEDKKRLLDYLDGKLNADAPVAEIDALNELLRHSPQARDFLRTHANIDTQLREIAISRSPEKITTRPTHSWFFPAITSLAACVSLWLVLQLGKKDDTISPTLSQQAIDGPISTLMETATPVAVLKSATDVQWSDPLEIHPTGSTLTAGWIRIAQGTLQIEFLSGARLLVNGPAELRLDSDNSAYLATGKASAYVPEPAHGFVLDSPGLNVKDLGTSFGLEVSADKGPEVHCFDGSVELSTNQNQSKPLLLPASKALQLNGNTLQEVPVRPADFPNGKELSERASIDLKRRLQDWKNVNDSLARDSNTLVLYTFDNADEWSRSVRNESVATSGKFDASIVGAGWTGGRWKGKSGLEFRSRGDRLRFTIPGEHQQISMSAWIRVDSLPNDYNSLMLPTHYQTGSLHWNIERGGEMRLTQLCDTTDPVNPDNWNGPVSGKGFNGLDFGRWLYIVTTYNCATGEVIHYRDGINVGNGTFAKSIPIAFGEMEFGNWGADGKSEDNQWILGQYTNQRVRNFVGRLDHLAIFSRVLSAEEISLMYQIGSP